VKLLLSAIGLFTLILVVWYFYLRADLPLTQLLTVVGVIAVVGLIFSWFLGRL
jgi:hypothetical protein